MATDVRKDLLETSTGVGHHYRPGYYFPSSNFKSVLLEPIPAKLAKPNEIIRDHHYQTTTGSVHDKKFSGGPYGNIDARHIKAPGSWNVSYNKDFHEKLQAGGFRKPLTMGNQTSETQEQFRNQPGLSEPKEFVVNPQLFNLHGHHTDGPAQQVYPNTVNEKLKGKTFYPKDKAIGDLMDPYLTTNNKVHRRFQPKELNGVAKKDAPTYWSCEEYTKAWGHGPQINGLPKDSVQHANLPMIDQTFFKSATTIRRMPKQMVPVPHHGLRTLKDESYQRPADVKCAEAEFCPIDTPYHLPRPGPRSAFAAPGMYNTEYENVGSKKPVCV